jgi:hypothetical protein
MKEIKLIFFDNCDTCNQEYPEYQFIFGYLNLCIDCYCKLTNKKQPKVVKSIKTFYKKVNDLGGTIIGEYKGSDINVNCICSEGHSCNPRPGNINNGYGMCKACAGNDSETSKQNFYKNIETLGGTIIGEYKDKGTPVDCICKEGHSCNPRPGYIRDGGGMCRICAGNDSETSKQNFYKNIETLGGTVIDEYINTSTPVKCICKNGHTCFPDPNHIQQGRGMCRICAGNDSGTSKQNFFKNIETLGGTIIGEYKGADTPVDCICSEGHPCNPRPSDIKQGHGMCKRCSNSRGYSKTAILWLNSISNSNSIQHAENGLEFKIPNIGDVDGYDNKTNTVYEFHGCYWHGCPRCFEPDYFNKKSKKTASDLYSKTTERALAIRNSGYNLIEMWECDFVN